MGGVTTDDVVDRRLADPRDGEAILLAVGHDGDDALADRIEGDLGGTVEAQLPFDTMQVTLAETALDGLCRLDGVESVEAEREVHLHDQGN